jgi:hypothetical protein
MTIKNVYYFRQQQKNTPDKQVQIELAASKTQR